MAQTTLVLLAAMGVVLGATYAFRHRAQTNRTGLNILVALWVALCLLMYWEFLGVLRTVD